MTDGDAPLPPWWRDLFSFGSPVPDGVSDKIRSAGESGLRALLAVLDEDFGERPVPRAGPDARTFAAFLLAEFAHEGRLPLFWRLADRMESHDPALVGICAAIAACGPSAGPSAIDRFVACAPDDPRTPLLAEIVAGCGHRSPEALAVVVHAIAVEPHSASELAVRYGDPAAIPALLGTFDATPDEGDDADPQLLGRLADAVRALGGELSPERAVRAEAAWRVAGSVALAFRHEHIAGFGFDAVTPRPAPADPCPCGSGHCYEACCEEFESGLAREAEERARVARNTPRP